MWYLHNVQHLRHNDIKPGNILVQDGRVFLTDFGISLDWSKALRSTTQEQSPALTPMYAPPETIQEGQARNSSADIWCLGCVFLEIMTVLKGRQVDEIGRHLKLHDPNSMPTYSKSLRSTRRWIEILGESVGYVGNEPLTWIDEMLMERPDRRLSAGQLQEKLNSRDLPRHSSSAHAVGQGRLRVRPRLPTCGKKTATRRSPSSSILPSQP